MELLFCWEVIKCGKEETCPAYYNRENVCYKQLDIFPKTLCPCGNRQIEENSDPNYRPNCRNCLFYKESIQQLMEIFFSITKP